MRTRVFLITIALMSSTSTYADTLDIGLGSDNLLMQYGVDAGSADYGRTVLGGGLLYATDDDKNDHLVLNLDMHLVDETGSKSPGLEAGVGPRLYFGTSEYSELGESENQSFLAFAVGGLVIYRFQDLNRLLLNAHLYYAPNITSLLDAEDFMDFNVSAGYEVVPSATVYLGYSLVKARFITSNDQTDSREINNNFHLGLHMEF